MFDSSTENATLAQEIAFVVANTGMGFAEVGELNLPQLRALQKALIEKIKMTGIGMFGAAGNRSSSRVELTPDQLDERIRQKKALLGKDKLSLEEVF